jgi:predicted nucleotidyltransferase
MIVDCNSQKTPLLTLWLGGSRFYGTDSIDSDVDYIGTFIFNVKNIFRDQLGVHSMHKTLGGVDIQIHEIAKFLQLLASGNITLAEVVLLGTNVLDSLEKLPFADQFTVAPPSLLNCWERNLPRIQELAEKSFLNRPWGHLKGWMNQTLQQVSTKGWNPKRALLVYRCLLEAKIFLTTKKIVCQYPELIDYSNSRVLKDIWLAKTQKRNFSNWDLVEKEITELEAEILNLSAEKKVKNDLSDLIGDILEDFRIVMYKYDYPPK